MISSRGYVDGSTVDAAIVMIEAMHGRIEKEPLTPQKRSHIVTECCEEVGPALFFSLAIIAVSLLPVFVLDSQEVRLFKPLALTKHGLWPDHRHDRQGPRRDVSRRHADGRGDD
jgi:Cu/Ag efflux pump CusA